MIKKGRKASRRKVSWFGTVRMRPFISHSYPCPITAIAVSVVRNPGQHPSQKISSGELRQIIRQRAPYFFLEHFGHGWNRPARLVQRDSLDAQHGKEKRRQSDPVALRMKHLADEIVERAEIDPSNRDARVGNVHQFTPEALFWAVQAHHD